MTTLLIGLNEIYRQPVLVALSLATGSLPTTAAAWANWFSAKDLWVPNTLARNRLHALGDRISFDTARDGESSEAAVSDYRSSLQAILDDLNERWVRIWQQ